VAITSSPAPKILLPLHQEKVFVETMIKMNTQRRFYEMCEANAYYHRNGKEELILEGVDVVEPEEEGQFRLINLFGEQKIIKGKLKSMNLVNHKILFEQC
jgi:predicted RNA-binding protein